MTIVDYLWIVAKEFMLVLFLGVMPYIIYAIVMQFLTNFIRQRLAIILGVKSYVLLTAPGVMIHELSHALFCLIFGHKIEEMKLFSPEDDGTLGYVNHSYNKKNLYHKIGNLFIGTGPIWGGITVLWIASSFLLPDGIINLKNGLSVTIEQFINHLMTEEFWTSWQSYLWLYIVITVSSHITLSPLDIQGATAGGLVLIGTILILELAVAWNNEINKTIITALEHILILLSPILLFSFFLAFLYAILLAICVRKK